MAALKLRAAVIGAGKMGSYHANIYKGLKNITLCAVATKTKASAKLKEIEFDVPAHTSISTLLKKEHPNVVSITTPTSVHKEITIKCLKAGCHVLLEKPISTNLREARAIVNATKKYKRKVMMGHIERFNPVVTEAKKILRSKKLGRLLLYTAIRSGGMPQNPSTDVLLDLGFHDLDLFRYLTKAKITKVWGKSFRKRNRKFEDFFSLTCKTESSIVAQFTTDWWRQTSQRETKMIGTKGELHMDLQNKKLGYVSESGTEIREISIDTSINQLEVEIKYFIDCIKKNLKPPISVEEGLKVLELYTLCMKGIDRLA